MKKITYCTHCIRRYSDYIKEAQFVEATTPFIQYCTATKKTVLCKNRNTKGKCKYYMGNEPSFPI